jgi:hypothetical protein
MKLSNAILASVIILPGCADTIDRERVHTDSLTANAGTAPDSTGRQVRAGLSWPVDKNNSQVGDLAEFEIAKLPACSHEQPRASSDSIGLLKAGMTASELLRKCPSAMPLWDASFEDIADPVAVVRLGDAAVVATFNDTLPNSRAWAIRVGTPIIKTSAGVGSGSSIEELVGAYGQEGEASDAECHVFVVFNQEPGIVWELTTSPDADCNELLPGQGKSVHRVPPKSIVKELRQVARK